MSEAAFAEAREEAEHEEAELEGVEAPEGEDGDEGEPKPKNWEKMAADAKGEAAKEGAKRRAADTARRELEARLEKLEAARGSDKSGEDKLAQIIARLRDDDEDP